MGWKGFFKGVLKVAKIAGAVALACTGVGIPATAAIMASVYMADAKASGASWKQAIVQGGIGAATSLAGGMGGAGGTTAAIAKQAGMQAGIAAASTKAQGGSWGDALKDGVIAGSTSALLGSTVKGNGTAAAVKRAGINAGSAAASSAVHGGDMSDVLGAATRSGINSGISIGTSAATGRTNMAATTTTTTTANTPPPGMTAADWANLGIQGTAAAAQMYQANQNQKDNKKLGDQNSQLAAYNTNLSRYQSARGAFQDDRDYLMASPSFYASRAILADNQLNPAMSGRSLAMLNAKNDAERAAVEERFRYTMGEDSVKAQDELRRRMMDGLFGRGEYNFDAKKPVLPGEFAFGGSPRQPSRNVAAPAPTVQAPTVAAPSVPAPTTTSPTAYNALTTVPELSAEDLYMEALAPRARAYSRNVRPVRRTV